MDKKDREKLESLNIRWATREEENREYNGIGAAGGIAMGAIIIDVPNSSYGSGSNGQEDGMGSIVVAAHEIAPSKVTDFDTARVKALLLETGGASSHSVILAQAMGIPCVIGLEGLLANVRNGEIAYIDGDNGEVVICADERATLEYSDKVIAFEKEREKLKEYVGRAAVTKDGTEVKVLANVSSLQETNLMLRNGGDGIGLLRTEFIFSASDKAPAEEEQYEIYANMAKLVEGRPLVIRTLDAAGDKTLGYLGKEKEDNPYLGYRAIRFCLDHRELFKSQITAVLRASRHGAVKLMFPMISTMEEWDKAVALVDEAKSDMDARGEVYGNLPIGMMMETPAAAILAERFARKADFFSVGTNDLTQYLFAADRGNSKLAYLNSPYHPALLRVVSMICEAAVSNDIEVDICGQAGEIKELVPLWLAMGVRTFSVSIPAITSVKKAICESVKLGAEMRLRTVLEMETASEVEAYLKGEYLGD